MLDITVLTLAQDDAPPAASGSPTPAPTDGESRTLAPRDGDTGGTSGGDTQQQGPPPSPFGSMGFLLVMVGLFAVMMIFSSRSQAKEKKKRQAMLSALKKGDKVETVGGIIGAVVEVREHDVVLKVDENANTRIKFSRNAIRSVAGEGDGPGGSSGGSLEETK